METFVNKMPSSQRCRSNLYNFWDRGKNIGQIRTLVKDAAYVVGAAAKGASMWTTKMPDLRKEVYLWGFLGKPKVIQTMSKDLLEK